MKSYFLETLQTRPYMGTENYKHHFPKILFRYCLIDHIANCYLLRRGNGLITHPQLWQKKKKTKKRLVKIQKLRVSINSLLPVFTTFASCWAKCALVVKCACLRNISPGSSRQRTAPHLHGVCKWNTGGEQTDVDATRPTCVQTAQWRSPSKGSIGESTPDGGGGRKEISMSEEQNQIVSSQFDVKI